MSIADTPMDSPRPEPDPAGEDTATGRPVLGAIAGLFLGLFVWIDLVLFGLVAFESVTFWLFPPLGLVLGIVLARWAPLRRSA